MEEVITIGLAIAKLIFHAHGADASGATVFSRRITRQKLLEFFASQPRCTVAMEACAGAHHWGRELTRVGHEVRLIPPAYVKPFVKRQKNDAADAEAICEAAQRPTMRFVPVKSEAQQASASVFRARDLLVRQRTQLLNALRGLLAEHGWVAPKGLFHANAMMAKIEDPSCELPASARDLFLVMIASVRALDEHFLGVAAAQRTSAAIGFLIDNSDALPGLCKPHGRRHRYGFRLSENEASRYSRMPCSEQSRSAFTRRSPAKPIL